MLYKHIENFTSTVLNLYVAPTKYTWYGQVILCKMHFKTRFSRPPLNIPPSPIKYQHLKLL